MQNPGSDAGVFVFGLVARMSAAISGADSVVGIPGFRCAPSGLQARWKRSTPRHKRHLRFRMGLRQHCRHRLPCVCAEVAPKIPHIKSTQKSQAGLKGKETAMADASAAIEPLHVPEPAEARPSRIRNFDPLKPPTDKPQSYYDAIEQRFGEERDLRLGYRPEGKAQFITDLEKDADLAQVRDRSVCRRTRRARAAHRPCRGAVHRRRLLGAVDGRAPARDAVSKASASSSAAPTSAAPGTGIATPASPATRRPTTTSPCSTRWARSRRTTTPRARRSTRTARRSRRSTTSTSWRCSRPR